jgi:alginate O-acetyltransferase complex protein AlgI
VANYIAEGLVNPVFQDPSSFGSGDLLLGAYGFAIQIFCDFSAYSDIAIGIALLFGFEFPENFRKPFRASSLQDFWRRWHISLSTWLRDYLYIPFGGSRGSEAQTYRNLLITMFLGGLWHGASWTFVIWGLMHGVGLAVERWFSKGKTPEVELASGQPVVGEEGKRTGARPNKIMAQIKKIFAVLGTFHFVLLTWIVFRASSFHQLSLYLRGLFTRFQGPTLITPFLALLLILGFLMHWGPNLSHKWVPQITQRVKTRYVFLFTLSGLLILGLLAPQGVADFIYFRF